MTDDDPGGLRRPIEPVATCNGEFLALLRSGVH